nr:hypothetical protein CFP56_21800 [Quercus suber]
MAYPTKLTFFPYGTAPGLPRFFSTDPAPSTPFHFAFEIHALAPTPSGRAIPAPCPNSSQAKLPGQVPGSSFARSHGQESAAGLGEFVPGRLYGGAVESYEEQRGQRRNKVGHSGPAPLENHGESKTSSISLIVVRAHQSRGRRACVRARVQEKKKPMRSLACDRSPPILRLLSFIQTPSSHSFLPGAMYRRPCSLLRVYSSQSGDGDHHYNEWHAKPSTTWSLGDRSKEICNIEHDA